MKRRKIQLIAGTTYSISLPKDWVQKNKLKEQEEVMIFEKSDGTLNISPEIAEEKNLGSISLNVDDFEENMESILFTIYYLGFENITLFSKKVLDKNTKFMIRSALRHMSGTEIAFEDKQKMILKVLLDKSKIDVYQVLYRLFLILDLSIANIIQDLDYQEIRINENEIDRLYQLLTKVISLSLTNTNILKSSKIESIQLIPSFFLVSKKLENLGDNLKYLGAYLSENQIGDATKKKYIEVLGFCRINLEKSQKHISRNFKTIYKKIDAALLDGIRKKIYSINDKKIEDQLGRIKRNMIDIEDEIVKISFYKKLINDGVL